MDRDVIPELLSAWGVALGNVIETMNNDSVASLTTTTGELLVLKDHGLAPPERQQRFAFDTAIVRHLDAAGVPVATPRQTLDGCDGLIRDGHLFSLCQLLRRGEIASEPAGRVDWLRNCGRAVAELHAALATYDMVGKEGATWEENIPEDVVRLVDNIRQHVTGTRRHRFESDIEAVIHDLRQTLQDLPTHLIHRDCHTGNVLFDGVDVTGFVDCDHFCVAPRLFDVAEFAVHLIKWDIRKPGAAARWLTEFPHILEGYDEVGRLTPRERVAFPYLMIAVQIIFASFLAKTDQLSLELDLLSWLRENLAALQKAAGALSHGQLTHRQTIRPNKAMHTDGNTAALQSRR